MKALPVFRLSSVPHYSDNAPSRSVSLSQTCTKGELGDPTNAGSSRHAEVQRRIQSCDRAAAATATALSTVTNTLSDFPARVRRRRRFSTGVSAGGVEQCTRERNRRFTLARNLNLPSAGTSVPVRAAPECREDGVPDGSSDGGRGIRRSASAVMSRGSRKPPAGDSRRDAAAGDGAGTEGRETGPASSFFTHAAPSPSAANERHAAQVPSPVARGGISKRHQPMTAPVMEERRRLMARASSDRFRGGSGEVGASALVVTKAKESKGSAEEAHVVRKIRKPTAAEQYAASVNLMHGRSTTASRRRIREFGEQEGATASTARSARGGAVATTMAARASSHRPTRVYPSFSAGSVSPTEAYAEIGEQGSAASVSTVRSVRSAAAGRVLNPRPSRMQTSTSAGPSTFTGARAPGDGVGYRGGGSGGGFGGAHLVPSFSPRPVPMTSVRAGEGAQDDGGECDEDGHGDSNRSERDIRLQQAMEERIAQAILGESNFLYLLDASPSTLFGDATHARRRSLMRMHTMGDDVDSPTASLRRSQSASRFGDRSRGSVEGSTSLGAVSRTPAGMRGDGDVVPTDVHGDEVGVLGHAYGHDIFENDLKHAVLKIVDRTRLLLPRSQLT